MRPGAYYPHAPTCASRAFSHSAGARKLAAVMQVLVAFRDATLQILTRAPSSRAGIEPSRTTFLDRGWRYCD